MGKRNEPYKWAVGKLERMLDRKLKEEIEKKPEKKTRKGKLKPILQRSYLIGLMKRRTAKSKK